MAEHDNSYKLMFSHAQMVEDLLRGFVKEAWVQQVDFPTLEKVNASFVSDDLKNREDDVIWRVKCKGQWLYVPIPRQARFTVETRLFVQAHLSLDKALA